MEKSLTMWHLSRNLNISKEQSCKYPDAQQWWQILRGHGVDNGYELRERGWLDILKGAPTGVAPRSSRLPGESQGWRSLVGCSPRGRQEWDMTQQLHFHFSLSCTGEGNGSPLQCSCLENPRDGGAWWAAVYGVAQSRKRLKRLSSSSSSSSPSYHQINVKDEGRVNLQIWVEDRLTNGLHLFSASTH